MDASPGEGVSAHGEPDGHLGDDELLGRELQELAAADFDLSLTGFDPAELDNLLVNPDDCDQADDLPPLPDVPVSRPGDLWLCGKRRYPHRVLCV